MSKRIMGRCLVLTLTAVGGTVWLSSPAQAEITTDQPATSTAVAVTTTQPTSDQTLQPGYAEALDIAVERAYASPTEYSMPYVEDDQLIVPVSQTASAETIATASADMPVTPASSETITDDPNTPSTDLDKGTLTTTTTSTTTSTKSGIFGPMGAEVIIEPMVERVPFTMDQLTGAQDEVLTLTADQLAGAANLRTAAIDPVNNRVVIKAATVTQEMREALAARYGASRVALQLVPGMTVPSPKLGRQWDTAPYYGGAYFYTSVNTCSTAFAWTHQGAHYMLTAGHCTALNGKAYNRDRTLGTVSADNWNNTTGSVKVNGKDYYSGDASTIKLTETSYGRIYKGSSTSTSARAVTSRETGRSWFGDTYCVGGQVTGEMCGFKVYGTFMSVRYKDGEVLRNATEGYRYGKCTLGGDSGAPIYNIKSDGTVRARGILSGGSTNTSGHCWDYFTDTYLAEAALPGIVKLGS
ncbi:S1 family peptidase [Micromonospora sp. NPDC047548]|uniref:S1 family peptidase n=1 Tax=Micromonospora sp. NPDC047548 TaxID=3155624 RepID=UPI0033D9BC5F